MLVRKIKFFSKLKKNITPIKPEFQWTVILVVHFFSTAGQSQVPIPFSGAQPKGELIRPIHPVQHILIVP